MSAASNLSIQQCTRRSAGKGEMTPGQQVTRSRCGGRLTRYIHDDLTIVRPGLIQYPAQGHTITQLGFSRVGHPGQVNLIPITCSTKLPTVQGIPSCGIARLSSADAAQKFTRTHILSPSGCR